MTTGLILIALGVVAFVTGVLTGSRGSFTHSTATAMVLWWIVAAVLGGAGIIWLIVSWVLS